MKNIGQLISEIMTEWDEHHPPADTYFDSYSVSFTSAHKMRLFAPSVTSGEWSAEEGSQLPRPLPSQSIRAKDILVIEDDELTRESLALFLRSSGYQVYTAADGNDGFEKLSSHPKSLIFLDLRMPGMDGFEFLRRVHEHPELSESRTVLVTGDDQAATEADGLKTAGFLRKPFELDSLLTYARTYCETEAH